MAYKNLGDALNKYLIEELTFSKVINADCLAYSQYGEKLMAIGSTLKHADDKTLVWGSGAIDRKSLPVKVKRIKAVRGKLTKDALDKMGLDCPEVYGDPALLLPMVYNPKIEKKHKIGIVPHYVDKGHAILKALIQEEGALFIDIEAGKNWKKFIRQVKSCDMILSSSLHGIIVAEAYGIQNAWVRFSDNVLGDGYKFRDYYSSVHKEHVEPLDLNEGYKISEIEEKIQQWRPIGWDAKVLLSSYPFQHCVRPQYLNVS